MSGPDDVPDDPDDVTLWAGRLRPWPARTPEDTQPDAAADVDDDTAVSPRGGSADEARRASLLSATAPVEEPADETVPTRRRSPSSPDPELDDHTEHTVVREARGNDPEPLAADTAAGSRRPRARPSAAAAAEEPEGAVREARVPSIADREIYRPRPDTAIRVPRSVPTARPSVAPDAAEADPRASRGRRTPVFLVLAAVALLVAGAAVALVLLMG